MNKKLIMNVIVIGSLVLYFWGMFIIAKASIDATTEAPTVNPLWVNIVAAVTTVLGLNAGAYLGLPDAKLVPTDFTDPETARGWATILYFAALFIAFLIAANTKFPHQSLTDMGGTILGLITGVLSVYLGRD
jgi:cellobiose-specific phosphotransferase system component IIC